MEWQIVFISGFFVGWFGKSLVMLLFNKFTKKKDASLGDKE